MFSSTLVIILAALILYIIYYTFLVRAIIQMLNRDTNTVLLTFSFFGLIPWAFIVGIMTMIIWNMYKKTLANT